MESDIPSLEQMEDIVLPSPVDWWPLAPGWWVAFAVLGLLLLSLLLSVWLHWRRNAYRREALRELEQARDIATVAILLKRTALAIYPRDTIASLNGERWLEWLDHSASEPVPKEVRPLLLAAAYQDWGKAEVPRTLRLFARMWIKEHRKPC